MFSSRQESTIVSLNFRVARIVSALVLALGLTLTASACGSNVQTNHPYTPAEGVNFDVGDPTNAGAVVHVRNLLIIAKGDGLGVISGSIVCADGDTLTGMTGFAVKADGTKGAAFTAPIPDAVALPSGGLVVLTGGPLITVQDPDLQPGLVASMTVTFAKAGQASVNVTVVDGTQSQYASISPSPSASATPSA